MKQKICLDVEFVRGINSPLDDDYYYVDYEVPRSIAERIPYHYDESFAPIEHYKEIDVKAILNDSGVTYDRLIEFVLLVPEFYGYILDNSLEIPDYDYFLQ